jgi:hypothetical protein
MMFNEIINLIYYTVDGTSPQENSVEVYANKESITRQEFYMSFQSGLKPSIMFKVRLEDFEMTRNINQSTKKEQYATKVLYNGAKYDIIRTFEKGEYVDVICS